MIPVQVTLADDSVVTLNPAQWLYVGAEVKKTKSGKPDWYECAVTLTTGTIVVKSRHDLLVKCLMGKSPACCPRWWSQDPSRSA